MLGRSLVLALGLLPGLVNADLVHADLPPAFPETANLLPLIVSGYADDSGISPWFRYQEQGDDDYGAFGATPETAGHSALFQVQTSPPMRIDSLFGAPNILSLQSLPSYFTHFVVSYGVGFRQNSPMADIVLIDPLARRILDGGAMSQTTRFSVDAPDPKGPAFTFSYGLALLPAPYVSRAYAYTARDRSDWMGRLAEEPDVVATVGDLVLPGAHQAGMRRLTNDAAILDLVRSRCGRAGANGPLVSVLARLDACGDGDAILTGARNLFLTQKDGLRDQLRTGARFFDLPVGVPLGSAIGPVQANGYAAGVPVAHMLAEIRGFLNDPAHRHEIVVLRFSDRGIDPEVFAPLSRTEIGTVLREAFPADGAVPFRLLEAGEAFPPPDIADLPIAEAAARARVYVAFETADSKARTAETARRLDDPTAMLDQLNATLGVCGDEGVSILTLHAKPEAALAAPDEALSANSTQWRAYLLASPFGNLRHGLKPAFDAAAYNRLSAAEAVAALTGCAGPVVLMNDFIDIALATHAATLTRLRAAPPE